MDAEHEKLAQSFKSPEIGQSVSENNTVAPATEVSGMFFLIAIHTCKYFSLIRADLSSFCHPRAFQMDQG
jgi:hypothetical protein